MTQATLNAKFKFWSYRFTTICKSIKFLYTLPPEKVDAFVKSYDVYNYDWAKEDELIADMGSEYRSKVKEKVIDYYSVLNPLLALGQVEKMYIPPAIDLSRSIMENQNLFEEQMSRDLGLKKGFQVLDIGCGRGRIASHMASYSGANVTGINIDHTQLENAIQFAKGNNLSEQCQFREGDINKLPLNFADNSLDAVYQVQVFSLSVDLLTLFKDVYRILKPGAKLGCLDWIRFSKFDANDAHHADLLRRIKPLIGAIGTFSVEEYVDLLQKAGFTVLKSENPSVGGTQADLIKKADRFYTFVGSSIEFLVRWKILPKHFKILFDRMTKDADALIEADREGLVSTCYYFLAQKPEAS